MTFDPIMLAAGAIGGLVGCVVTLAGGLLALRLEHRRDLREIDEGDRRLHAASDRYDGAYARAVLTELQQMGGR